MNYLEEVYKHNPEAESFAQGYLDYLKDLITQLDLKQIAAFIATLWQVRERNGRIFFIGNGGSASTASHFANDIDIGTRTWAKPFRAVSLVDNIAVLTAIGNDYGYEEIFVRQLTTQMSPGDVVVAISASGNSPNVIKAVEYANANGAVTVALTGFDGGGLKKIAQICVHVPTNKGEYGPVEDIHLILDHLSAAYLQQACRAGDLNMCSVEFA
jgi:D-sedoheptulose 7-phosphate isomerase